MWTEGNRRDARVALLYELRLRIKNSGKEQYTKDELFDLLDATADAKDQE